MKGPLVVDSTCLIGLELIEKLEILPALFQPVLAPSQVVTEFGSAPTWLMIQDPTNRPLLAALALSVDDGEAAALALAIERSHRVGLDDLKARKLAAQLGIPIIGTVGILVEAKRAGLIPWLTPLLAELNQQGFRLSEDVRKEALRLAGE